MFTGRFAMQRSKLESMQRHRLDGFSGVSFDPDAGLPASNVPPVSRSEVPAPDKPELLARLWALRPESSELKTRLSVLLEELGPIWSEAEELEKLIVAEQQQQLESRHREILRQGREQNKLYLRLAKEYQDAEFEMQNAGLRNESLVEAVRDLDLLQQRGLHVSRWADDSEISEWNARVEQAKNLVPPANRRFAEAVAHRNDIAAKLELATVELERLGAEEIRLRKKLSGEAFVDPELGLPVSGS